MQKIDITKPIHAVSQFLWKGAAGTRVAQVLCSVPGSKCYAVVQIDGYSTPQIFDLTSGFVLGGSYRIENTPPKMVKKDITLHTAVMRSTHNRIFVVSRVDDCDAHNKEIQNRIKDGATLLCQYRQLLRVEVPEELSVPT